MTRLSHQTRRLVPVALLALSCSPSEDAAVAWQLSAEEELLLSLPSLDTTHSDSTARVAYTLSSGAIVTAQRLPLHSESGRVDRTPASVGAALAERLTLNEHPGALEVSPCDRLGVQGSCLTGWIESENTRFHRSGFVFVSGDQIVWVDVASGSMSESALAEEAERVLSTGRVVTRGAAPTAHES